MYYRKEQTMKRILFVDDDKTAHPLLKAMFPDWQILSAYTGLEALEVLEKEYGLIVITDVHMPKMDGIKLLKAIREKHPMVQVIVLSATDQSQVLLEAYKAGANDFISKPFEREEVIEAINNTKRKIDRWEQAMGNLHEKKGKCW